MFYTWKININLFIYYYKKKTLFSRLDQSLTSLSCYILRAVFHTTPLTSHVQMSSILSTPIMRYTQCLERRVRDCGVLFYLRDLLTIYQNYLSSVPSIQT